jgi:branched-chain amino acid aminotransferase
MKMEAIKAGCDYAVGLDEEGFLAEGSTENVAVVTAESVLRFPEFERTLSGITASRVFSLAKRLVEEKVLEDVVFSKILPEQAHGAREMFLTGTSINVLPVVLFDGKQIGGGIPGPVFSDLSRLIWEDMTTNESLLTPVNWDSAV